MPNKGNTGQVRVFLIYVLDIKCNFHSFNNLKKKKLFALIHPLAGSSTPSNDKIHLRIFMLIKKTTTRRSLIH